MPADDLYWNSIDFGSEESLQEPSSLKNYVDPWDLENYAYIREHLDSIDLESEPSTDFESNSTPFHSPPQREQNYAAIDEFRHSVKPRPRSQQRYYDVVTYRDHFDYEYDENPYEVNVKDVSLFPYVPELKDRRRYAPNLPPRKRTPRDRSFSFAYGDYGTSQDIYSRLDDVYTRQDTTLPIYYDVMSHRRRPTNFSLSNYGHLKIDYSYSWNKLDRYICN